MKSQLKFNLLALGFDFKTVSNSPNFSFDILEKPSRKIFEIVIYFLVSKIKPSLVSKKLQPNCSAKEGGDRFKKAIEEIVKKLRDEFPQFLIPKCSTTLLKSPKGPPAIELLFQLSILALFQSLDGNNDSSILVPVKLDSEFASVQVHTYKLAALSTYKNLCSDIRENQKNQKVIEEFFEEQLDKKNQLLIRNSKLIKRYEDSIERREDKILLSGSQKEELKKTVENYWKKIVDAVDSTEDKFEIFQRVLKVYKDERILDGGNLVPKIPLILKKKFEVELYKEVGEKFLENGSVDLTKLPILCNFALKMMKEILQETRFSNLSSKSNLLKEDLKQGIDEVNLLSKILKDLKDQLKDYEENSKDLKDKLDQIYVESYKQLKINSTNNLDKTLDLLFVDDPIEEDEVEEEYLESESFKESLKEIVVTSEQKALLEFLQRSKDVDDFMFQDSDLSETDLPETDLPDEDPEDLPDEDQDDLPDKDQHDLLEDDSKTSFEGSRNPDDSSDSSSSSSDPSSSRDDLSSSSRDKDRKNAAMNKLADMIVESTLNDDVTNDDVTNDSWLLGDVEELYDEEVFKSKNKIERTPEQKSCSSKIIDPLISDSFDQKIDLPEVGSLLDDEDYAFMEEVSSSCLEEDQKDEESCEDAPLIFFDSPPGTSLASEDQDKVSFEDWKRCQKKIKSKKVSRISWYNIVPDSWHHQK